VRGACDIPLDCPGVRAITPKDVNFSGFDIYVGIPSTSLGVRLGRIVLAECHSGIGVGRVIPGFENLGPVIAVDYKHDSLAVLIFSGRKVLVPKRYWFSQEKHVEVPGPRLLVTVKQRK
jgi:hypothetical protein